MPLHQLPIKAQLLQELVYLSSSSVKYEYPTFRLNNDPKKVQSRHLSQESYLKTKISAFINYKCLSEAEWTIIYDQWQHSLKKSNSPFWLRGLQLKATPNEQHAYIMATVMLLDNNRELAEFLMTLGKHCHISLDAKNDFQLTALHKTLAQHNQQASDFLLKHGAKLSNVPLRFRQQDEAKGSAINLTRG